jgi:molecular chaperone HtpG
MQHQPFQVHLQGVLDVLSNHLYSSEQVFIRELLQNACDAISARRLINPQNNGEIHIELITEGENPQLIIEDNGVGLSESEVIEFLSSIGASAKRGYESSQRDNFIGQFGIGLLSCFMVSENITLITQKEGQKPVKWIGKIDGTYEITSLDYDLFVGTKVYLSAKNTAKKFFEEELLRDLIKEYGEILPYDILFSCNGTNPEKLNSGTPIWERQFSDKGLRRNAILDYGYQTFGVPFNDYIDIDLKPFDARGLIYILTNPINPNSKSTHKVFLKRMLLSDNADNILPDWAFFVKGVLNVSKLRPTASRESFYEDENLIKFKDSLGKAIKSHFLNLAETNSDKLEKIISIHHLAFKSMALTDDDLFDIVIRGLKFTTNQGEKTVFDITDSVIKHVPDVDEFRKIAPIATTRNTTIINSGYVYDAQLLGKLRQKKFKKKIEVVDVNNFIEIFEDISASEKHQTIVFMELCREILDHYKCRPEIKRFKPDTLPTLYYMSDTVNHERQIKGAIDVSGDLWGGILGNFMESYNSNNYSVLCFNFDNPIVKRLISVKEKELLSTIISILYVNSLLMGHHPLDVKEMNILNANILELINWTTK